MKKNKSSLKLTKTQLKIIDVLKRSDISKKFYWSGGTLLAHYYLEHRYSLDMDFFSETEFSYNELIPFLNLLKKDLPDIKNIEEFKIFDRWEFILKNKEISRLDFVYYNGQRKRLKPLKKYLGILIDSLEDIAANKVVAYFDRNEPKDLFDIYFILKKFEVKKLLDFVRKKFQMEFSEFMFWSESAKSLNKLDKLRPLIVYKDRARKDKLINEINDFFVERGKEYLENRL